MTIYQKEIYYQLVLEKYLNGRHMAVETGITDVTTDAVHAEIKIWDKWPNAFKQLLLYNSAVERENLQAYMFGNLSDELKAKAVKYLNRFNIEVFEFRHVGDQLVIYDYNTNVETYLDPKYLIMDPKYLIIDMKPTYIMNKTPVIKQVIKQVTKPVIKQVTKSDAIIINKKGAPKKPPYTCPCCEYSTSKKCDILNHFYKLKKPCPKSANAIELTEEIKQYILQNRIYYIQELVPIIEPVPIINTASINQYNQLNNSISKIDIMDKLNKYTEHTKIELIGFKEKVENNYKSKVKKLNMNIFEYNFKFRPDNLLEIVDEVSKIYEHNFEDFNILYDEKLNKLKLYEDGVWEFTLINSGIKNMMSIIQNIYFDAYECYLIRKIKTNNVNENETILLMKYYKFIGCFDINPYVLSRCNAEVMKHGEDDFELNDDYSIEDEFMSKYKNICDQTTKSELNKTKRDVLDIIKRNSKHNISEFNKKVCSLLQMDSEFKKHIVTLTNPKI